MLTIVCLPTTIDSGVRHVVWELQFCQLVVLDHNGVNTVLGIEDQWSSIHLNAAQPRPGPPTMPQPEKAPICDGFAKNQSHNHHNGRVSHLLSTVCVDGVSALPIAGSM